MMMLQKDALRFAEGSRVRSAFGLGRIEAYRYVSPDFSGKVSGCLMVLFD
jgi:hypothetical protein